VGRLGLFHRAGDDFGASHGDHHVGGSRHGEICCFDAEARGKNSVGRHRRTPALDVAKDRDPGFETRLIFDRRGDLVGHATQSLEPERVFLVLCGAVSLGRFNPLGNHNDRVSVAGTVPRPQFVDDFGNVIVELGYEDGVGPARDSRICCYPALRSPHDLDDHDSIVSFCRGGETVDGVSGYLDGCRKSECRIRSRDVVVDGLWNADDVQSFVGQARRGTESPVASDDDEFVDPVAGEGW